MGQVSLDRIVALLNTGGFIAERGFTAECLQNIDSPVCTVNLQEAEFPFGKFSVLVRVLSPADMGAKVCEETAMEAADTLLREAVQCKVSACTFDSRTGLFCTEVTAVYGADTPSVTLDSTVMEYVRVFTSWRQTDEFITEWEDAPWIFQIEEFIPEGKTPQSFNVENFSIMHTWPGGKESFQSCTWIYQRRTQEIGGIRQIWRGKADIWNGNTES